MKQYLDMIQHVLENGEERGDRTGTGTIGVFGYQTRFDLQEGFPLLTTKKMYDPETKKGLFNQIFHELQWFLRGETNIKYLVDRGVNIWNDDAYRWFKEKNPEIECTKEQYIQAIKEDEFFAKEYGDLGRIYGKQWTDFGGDIFTVKGGINQVEEAIRLIKEEPNSRRIIISAWNPYDMKGMALPPCHVLVQFYITNDGKLSAQLYQRSGDLFLGVSFNIASYALFIYKLAFMTGLAPGELIYTLGDLHLYKNHIEQAKTQLEREPYPLPKLLYKGVWDEIKEITDFKLDDFALIDYQSHGILKGDVSVGLPEGN